MSTTARRRPWLRPVTAVICGVIGLGGVGLTAPAAAAPPSPSPLPGDSAGGATATVRVDDITPRDLVGHDDGRVIVVRGRITNSGRVPLAAVRLRLQRGPLISTRSGLHQVDADSGDLTPVASCDAVVLTPGAGLPTGGLGPRRSQAFVYRCPASVLAMRRIGIYPLVLTTDVSPDGVDYLPAAAIHTYLPSFPDGASASTRVSWLWPLVDRPHRLGPDGRFLDDDLARSVAPGGRLDRLLSVAERVAHGVKLTLAVDPALVDELSGMERGYVLQDGRPGRHGAAARSWLDRLQRLAAAHTVVALPYGDPDVVALRRAGVADLARPVDADRDLLADRLKVKPSTVLAWPPGDAVTPDTLTALVQQGARAVVLNAASLPAPPVDGPTPSAVARLQVPGDGSTVALVPDPDVTAVVQGSRTFPGGPRLAEQRYLTELAMITAEAPSKGRELIVVPPRRWDPDPASAVAMLDDTVSVSWLSSGSAIELAGQQPQVDRGSLVYPQQGRRAELPADLVQAVARAAGSIADFRTALLDDASVRQEVEPLDAALRTAVSSAWRDDPATGRTFLDALDSDLRALRSGVYVVRPSGSGVYSLASSDSPLFITIGNRTDVPVRIRLQINSRGAPGFSVGDVGEQVIPSHNRRTLRVPAHVDRAGVFVVDALVTTPGGQPLGHDGAPVQLTVRSTAYGVIGLAITGGALVLFLLLAVRRLLRHVRGRRGRNSPVDDGTGGTGDPSGPGGVPDDDPDGPLYGGVVAGEATLGRAPDADPAFVPAERSSV